MQLTGVREAIYYIGVRKLPAWVAHHHCGWSTGMFIGNKKLKSKGWDNTPSYVKAKRILEVHSWVCKVSTKGLNDQAANSTTITD